MRAVASLIFRSFAARPAPSPGTSALRSLFAAASTAFSAAISTGKLRGGDAAAAVGSAWLLEIIAAPIAVPALMPIKVRTVALIVSMSPRPVMIQRKQKAAAVTKNQKAI